jgi:hypothetical protein
MKQTKTAGQGAKTAEIRHFCPASRRLHHYGAK